MIKGYFFTAVLAFGLGWLSATLLPIPWDQGGVQEAPAPASAQAPAPAPEPAAPAALRAEASADRAQPVPVPAAGAVRPRSTAVDSAPAAAPVAGVPAPLTAAEAGRQRAEARHARESVSIASSAAVTADRVRSNSAAVRTSASGRAAQHDRVAQQEYGSRCQTLEGICTLPKPQPVGSVCYCKGKVRGTTIR